MIEEVELDELLRMGEKIVTENNHGSSAFHELLKNMGELHARKSHDYASDDDPYGNYHFAGMVAEMFSHNPDDMGFVSRLAEKLYRLANLEKNGLIPLNETIEDTELDLCVIMVLWMADRREARQEMEERRNNARI